jgi:hypothetical protein
MFWQDTAILKMTSEFKRSRQYGPVIETQTCRLHISGVPTVLLFSSHQSVRHAQTHSLGMELILLGCGLCQHDTSWIPLFLHSCAMHSALSRLYRERAFFIHLERFSSFFF